MNITRRWKRFMAVGCSHGHYADKALLKEVLAFKKRWDPHQIIHLGDAIDLACFRTGAINTKDDSTDPTSDIESGLLFLSQLEPSLYSEPVLVRMADGGSDWVDRMRLLGNGVVPATAELAFRTLTAPDRC